MKPVKILAIETSAELCSAALSFSPDSYDERNIKLKHIHSEKLIPIIDEIFKSNKFLKTELDSVAVSVGPGSFTGLRIGLTAAKGIAFALGIPIIPVPTFDALAYEISDYVPFNTNFHIINNANKDECYYAAYSIKDGEIRNKLEVNLIKKREVRSQIGSNDIVFGNFSELKNIKLIASPKASSIIKWTYLFGEDLLTFDYDYLEPNYLKNFKAKKTK